MKIAVFASGNGSNFQVIAEQFQVSFVFSDHRDAYVLERAQNLAIPSFAFELKEFENKTAYEQAIVDLLDKHEIDLVCLAGYMKIVGETLLSPMRAVSSIFTQPTCLNFQVPTVSRMLGKLVLTSLA